MIDYIAIDERMKNDMMDAIVVSRLFQDSDHFAVLSEVRTEIEWVHGAKKKGGSKRLAN